MAMHSESLAAITGAPGAVAISAPALASFRIDLRTSDLMYTLPNSKPYA